MGKAKNEIAAQNQIGGTPQVAASVDVVRQRILTFRGVQVLLDRDLAELYGVTTGALNQAVKRNAARFPERFMFQLSDEEFGKWKSQIVISNLSEGTVRMGLRKKPFAFTEHGVAMLASVLKSETAIRVSLAIIDAFIAMRRLLIANTEVFRRIETVERRQIADQAQNEERFKRVFKELDARKDKVQGVFYNGQLWDARAFADRLIRSAVKSILLIDNWATVETLDMFVGKKKGVSLTVVMSEHFDRKRNPRHKINLADIAKFNSQYPTLTVRFSENFHDRFIAIDDKELYLIGASLKDLGKKCFAFTKLDASEIPNLKARV